MGHRHTTQITEQISLQTHHYSFGFSGHSRAQSASMLQIRKADWVASYRQSKRIVLLPERIPLFPVLAQIIARVHKKRATTRHYSEN